MTMKIVNFWNIYTSTDHGLVDVAGGDDVLNNGVLNEQREWHGRGRVTAQLVEDTLQSLLQTSKQALRS